jgi:hypothetical protein
MAGKWIDVAAEAIVTLAICILSTTSSNLAVAGAEPSAARPPAH